MNTETAVGSDVRRALCTLEYTTLIEREGVYLAKISDDWYCLVAHEDDWYPAWAFLCLPAGDWYVPPPENIGDAVLIHFLL